uniref:KIB1-4 beta-propeller domain-containing protein n=1 Tax=Leersia perrieri TaxID=77586 RepID=A0A0D9WTT8_9ORYZ
MGTNDTEKTNCSEELMVPLALFAVELNSKKRLMFDVSSRTIRGITSTLFPDAFCEFENGGWLLMARHKPLYFKEQIVYLVHPSTGRRVDLPVLPCPNEGFFVFYVGSHGMPLVVAFIEIMTVVPTIHIACPGDVYWSIYKHTSDPERSEPMHKFKNTLILDVVLLGKQVVCVESHGKILAFNISEMTWRTVSSCPDWSEKDSHFLVVFNREVVAISHPHKTGSAFKFFKLDLEAMKWSVLGDRELDNTSWFLCKGQSYRVKEEGKRRVYLFGPNICAESLVSVKKDSNGIEVCTYIFTGSLEPATSKSITNIYAYDLFDETAEMVIPASIVTEIWRN